MTTQRINAQYQRQLTLPKWFNGQVLFLLIGTFVSGLNMLQNLLMGRLLSPENYGQMTFFVTLLMIIGLLTSSFQTTMSRFTAGYITQGNNYTVQLLHQHMRRIEWFVIGILVCTLVMFAYPLADMFNIDEPIFFYMVAIAIPFYLLTGVDRGALQGREDYNQLSMAYLGEALMRLIGSVALVILFDSINKSLHGAIVALTLSLLITWWIARPRHNTTQLIIAHGDYRDRQSEWSHFLQMTIMVLIGQMLITNSDFLLVKIYFSSTDAGYYAAISVIGRIVYFGTLPVTVIMVPMLARQQATNRSTTKLLTIIMASGVLLCSVLILSSHFFAPQIVELLYGSAYLTASNQLALYTVAASLFVMTNLVVTYRMALGKTGETWMPLLAGIAQVAGIMLFHESLEHVILVQIIVMGFLLSGTIASIMYKAHSD